MAFIGAGPVDKHGISIRMLPIAVEAFGRYLKRVDASALFFCRFVREIRPVKTCILLGKRRSLAAKQQIIDGGHGSCL